MMKITSSVIASLFALATTAAFAQSATPNDA